MAASLLPTTSEMGTVADAVTAHIGALWLPCGSMSVTAVLAEILLCIDDEDYPGETDAEREIIVFRERFGEAAMLRAIGVALSTWEFE